MAGSDVRSCTGRRTTKMNCLTSPHFLACSSNYFKHMKVMSDKCSFLSRIRFDFQIPNYQVCAITFLIYKEPVAGTLLCSLSRTLDLNNISVRVPGLKYIDRGRKLLDKELANIYKTSARCA